jgi:hypothetical protein
VSNLHSLSFVLYDLSSNIRNCVTNDQVF